MLIDSGCDMDLEKKATVSVVPGISFTDVLSFFHYESFDEAKTKKYIIN